MKKRIIVEVGSTNTKSYLYDEEIKEIGLVTIEFKNNYKKFESLIESDLNTLYNYINDLKSYKCGIHVYGTSIFRNLSDAEFLDFKETFRDRTGLDFTVVTADMENELTVFGVINNNDYTGRVAVVIGGGGSTELSIIENKKIIERANSSFGAMDVCDEFPDIGNDKATSDFKMMVARAISLCNKPENKADVLVLAGGDYLRFYLTLDYPIEKNTIYEDINQPYMIKRDVMEECDYDFFYNKSLKEIQDKDSLLKGWWTGGTRGMRICIYAVAEILEAKQIIPSKISMVYGIVEKLKNSHN